MDVVASLRNYDHLLVAKKIIGNETMSVLNLSVAKRDKYTL